jgi:hypothetical protein
MIGVALRALRCVSGFLKRLWERTSSLLIFGVAALTLVVALLAYYQQIQTDAPQFGFAGQFVRPMQAHLIFMNIGRRPATQVTAALFPVSEGHKHGKTLGQKPLLAKGGGSNVLLPQLYGEAEFHLPGDAPDLLLVCLTYFDDRSPRAQAFILRPRRVAGASDTPLDEVEQPPYGEVCN